jgi:hypothetical protein
MRNIQFWVFAGVCAAYAAAMRGYGAPAGDRLDGGVARWAVAAISLLLAMGATAAPATAASPASPAVQAASSGGTPTIPPPGPDPLTCTPSRGSIFCTRRAETCETIGGVRTCYVQRVTCLQIGRYKRCVLAASTCRTVTSPLTGRPRTTCRTGGITFPRIAAGIAAGSIPRFTHRPSPTAARRSATTLVSTTTAAAPPVGTAVVSPGPTVPAGAGLGTLVLVLALIGLTIARRRPRSGG